MKYDYLIVGSGLFGAVFARKALDAGKTCLVLEKRSHIGGNVYCNTVQDIPIHQYGAHIFHTSDPKIWDFITSYCVMNDFINSPVAVYQGERYNLPFNMNTFKQMWGVTTAQEAQEIIDRQRQQIKGAPKNLEEQAISLVGTDIYEKLIRHYTEKQWGRPCVELPAFIIRRLPVRFTYDNNYFNDTYQGIPQGGYNSLVKNLFSGAEIRLNVDYNYRRNEYRSLAERVIYTGTIDSYFDHRFGKLEYRSLRFENEYLPVESFQGNAVVNYTDGDTPFTRIIEHKFFEKKDLPYTIISREYPIAPSNVNEPFYPVNDDKNSSLYEKYRELTAFEKDVFFGGRLAEYRYYDMDKTVASSLSLAEQIL